MNLKQAMVVRDLYNVHEVVGVVWLCISETKDRKSVRGRETGRRLSLQAQLPVSEI
jgi:hypothetical protein